MKNLGKIIILVLFLQQSIYASVSASVDYSSVSYGETVTYMLKFSDANVQRPEITTLCDSPVISTASQTSIEMINGDYKRSKVLSYKFMPQKSCVIAPLDVIVNNKKEITNAVKVEVKAAAQDLNANFILSLSMDKKEVYVGETFVMTLLIKQKHNAQLVDSKFVAPELKSVWLKEDPVQTRYDDGSFRITKLVYKIAAQRAGDLTVKPAQIAIASRVPSRDMWNSFTQQVKWKSYFSNSASVNVKALPSGVVLAGDFTISATVDKSEVNPNEAINVTLSVHGDGNLEDIQNFKPHIEDVSVFDEKPVVKGINFTQKIALVGDNNFVIPSFSLKFFNPKTKEVKEISTEEIHIKVKGAKAKKALTIQRENVSEIVKSQPATVVTQKTLPLLLMILLFISGLLVGALVMFFKPWKRFQREKQLDIKDEKKLLIKLMPFSEDSEVQSIIDVLEHNIYSKDKKQVDKKLLKELLKRYDIS